MKVEYKSIEKCNDCRYSDITSNDGDWCYLDESIQINKFNKPPSECPIRKMKDNRFIEVFVTKVN